MDVNDSGAFLSVATRGGYVHSWWLAGRSPSARLDFAPNGARAADVDRRGHRICQDQRGRLVLVGELRFRAERVEPRVRVRRRERRVGVVRLRGTDQARRGDGRVGLPVPVGRCSARRRRGWRRRRRRRRSRLRLARTRPRAQCRPTRASPTRASWTRVFARIATAPASWRSPASPRDAMSAPSRRTTRTRRRTTKEPERERTPFASSRRRSRTSFPTASTPCSASRRPACSSAGRRTRARRAATARSRRAARASRYACATSRASTRSPSRTITESRTKTTTSRLRSSRSTKR